MVFFLGSSAGAGSGEFHVYRHLRRKEYARQRFIEEQAKHEELDRRFKETVEEKKRKVEEKTAKKRAKRLRKKEKIKQARKSKKLKRNQEKEITDDEDTEDDNESIVGEDEKADSKLTTKSVSIDENEDKSVKEMKFDEKILSEDETVGNAPIPSKIEATQSKPEEIDSDNDEIIGPMPHPINKNCQESKSEKVNDSETNIKSKPNTFNNQGDNLVDPNNSESDTEAIGPMPTKSTDQDESKCEDQVQDGAEESSDDEMIGPMPI